MKAVYSFLFSSFDDKTFTTDTKMVYDESGKLLGAYTITSGNIAKAWLSGTDSEVGIKVSTGTPFYITPRFDDQENVAYAIVSELPIGMLSEEVTAKLEAIHEIT